MNIKISLMTECEEIKELLEKYSLLQEKVKQHVVKISKCISCEKNGKIVITSTNTASAYLLIDDADEVDPK
jgi:hypothetical protein